MILHVFDYNYSSWSMRAGVILRASGLSFEERAVPRDPKGEWLVPNFSPSGLFPLLEIDSMRVWDSLAIAETIAEQAAQLWPSDMVTRANARSISGEMHAGFAAIRQQMPMNIRARHGAVARSAEVDRQWGRIFSIWQECLAQQEGPFLFGDFCIADAMYSPIVMRARTYGVELNRVCEEYARRVETHPAVVDWLSKAHAETLRSPKYDFPPKG